MRAIERSPKRYRSAQEMLKDLDDPSQVVLGQRGDPEQRRPLLARLRVPLRALGPVLVVLVIATLLGLTWLMSRSQ